MKNSNKAFTLIELLVVVLIIGILAAVAVPQYKKTVYKSHYAKLKILTASIAQAQETYYLANGVYANDLDALDITFPENTVTHEYEENETDIEAKNKRNRYYEWGQCYTTTSAATCRNNNIAMGYYIFFNASAFPNQRRCVAFDTLDENSLQAKICQTETGDTPHKVSSGGPYIFFWY